MAILDNEATNARRRALRFLFGNDELDSSGPLVRNAFPAYRVFLFGFEITEDVTSITVQNHVGQQPNSCTITLLNERDKYVLTTEDIFFLTNIDPSLVVTPTRDLSILPFFREGVVDTQQRDASDQPLTFGDPNSPVTDDFRLANPLSVKNNVFFLKQQHKKIPVQNVDETGNPRGGVELRGRWPFADGVPIFHPNDPLRVFVRDLFNPDIWYYGFSGFVTDISDSVTKDNQKMLSISAEDPTKLLRYARAITNPGVRDAALVTTEQDIQSRTANTSLLANKTLVEIMNIMVFGTQGQTPPEPQTETAARVLTMSEDDLQLLAINSGLVTDIERVSLDPDATTLAQIKEELTPSERQALSDFVARERESARIRAEYEDQLNSKFFEIDHINRFGGRVVQRFGLTGVGAFKPASRSAVESMTSLPVDVDAVLVSAAQELTDQAFEAAGGDEARARIILEQQVGADTATALINNRRAGALSEQQLQSLRSSFNRSADVDSPDEGAHVYTFGDDPILQVAHGAVKIDLQTWNNIISWQVRMSDLRRDTGLLSKDTDDATFFRESVSSGRNIIAGSTEDVITIIGEDPVNFPVDGGRLYMLLPGGAGIVGQEVVSESLVQSWNVKSGDFQNRLSLIYDALSRIEFVFYCTPKGDLVVEFPLYDFDPDDFGQYEPRYIAELDDTYSSDSTFSDAQVRTIAIVQATPFNYAPEGQRAAEAIDAVVVKMPALFPTYGTRQEVANMKGLIRTYQAAQLYGQILLNRINADAHSVNLPIISRFDAGLNRPYLWKVRNHLGSTMSVVHNLQWNGSWRTTLGLNHMRGWTGQMEGRPSDSTSRGSGLKMVYVPIGGQNSRPINYKVLFARQEEVVTGDINLQDQRQGERSTTVQPEAT